MQGVGKENKYYVIMKKEEEERRGLDAGRVRVRKQTGEPWTLTTLP